MQHIAEYDCSSSACSQCTESEEEDKIDRDGESSRLKEGGIATESSMEHRGLSMISKLSRMASEFQETVNAMRSKEHGKAHSYARAEMLTSHSKSGKRRFTPELMHTTFNEDETEIGAGASLASHTPRKRTIAKWEFVMECARHEYSKEKAFETFAEYAKNELAKAGPFEPQFEDTHASETDLGGFRASNAMFFTPSSSAFTFIS